MRRECPGRLVSGIGGRPRVSHTAEVLPERVGLGKESLCVQLNAGGVEEKISFDRLLAAGCTMEVERPKTTRNRSAKAVQRCCNRCWQKRVPKVASHRCKSSLSDQPRRMNILLLRTGKPLTHVRTLLAAVARAAGCTMEVERPKTTRNRSAKAVQRRTCRSRQRVPLRAAECRRRRGKDQLRPFTRRLWSESGGLHDGG
jgi:hypothetical protein